MIQAQFSQMRPPVPMTPTVAPRLPMYPPMAPQQLFYGQAPPAMIPPQVPWKLYFFSFEHYPQVKSLVYNFDMRISMFPYFLKIVKHWSLQSWL